MATKENWEEVIRTNYFELLKNINTDGGLFGELKKTPVFNAIALKKYKAIHDTTTRIQSMLDDLKKKDFESFKKFCEALSKSGQDHIVRDHLSAIKDVSLPPINQVDNRIKNVSAQGRGISPGMLECLKQHYNKLLVDITFDNGLLAEIEVLDILNALQLNTLKDMQPGKRVEQMLDWLEHGSEKRFLDFCIALENDTQVHIVKQYLTPKTIPDSTPLVIQEVPAQSREIRRVPKFLKEPEGCFHLIPPPAEVAVNDICFQDCSEEFLKGVKAKVLAKAAYKCDSNCRGRALIMNNGFISQPDVRHGCEVDTKNLEALFKRLHFDTVVHCEKTSKDMLAILDEESREDHHKKYDMFVLFLMSHGNRGEIFGNDCKPLKTEDIWNLFNGKNCPNLLSKPKLFFIQACQGDVKTQGVISMDAGILACDSALPVQDSLMDQMMRKLSLEDDFNLSIPLEPLPEIQSDAVAGYPCVHESVDMAFFYASVQGYAAYRNTKTGSFFVNCLVDVLKKGAHETDLVTMATPILNNLHESEVEIKGKYYKAAGEFRHRLRRTVYLLPL